MRLFLALSLVVFLAGCSSTGPLNEPAKLEPLTTGAKVKTLWKASMPTSSYDMAYEYLTPVIDDLHLYSVAAKGVVQAYDIVNGKKVWKKEIDAVISGGLGKNDQLLFLGLAKAEVIALSSDNGEIQWRTAVSSEVLAPPIATATHVIVRCGDGVVYALNAESGAVMWQFSRSLPVLSLRGDAQPLIVDDNVLLGLADGHLLALSIYDGSVRWEAVVTVPQGRTDLERMIDVDATPVVIDDVVYSSAYQGRVVALSMLTGSLLWSNDIGSSAGLTVDMHHVYVTDDLGQVWALDRRNGASLWKQDKLKYRDLTAPVRSGDAVIVGDFEGYLHWLSIEDGRMLARHQTDDKGLRIAPITANENVFVRSKVGKLQVLSLQQ